MRHTAKNWVLLAAGALLLTGCEETATKHVQVRPPAATPAPAPAPDYSRLQIPPSRSLPVQPALYAHETRPAIDILVEQVRASFDAGQRELKAGNEDKAQEYFERAIDQILKGGFQPDADPRLTKLFDQLGEVSRPEVAATDNEATDDQAEAPSEPAPIDEIADLTLPAGDPRLALKAQNELITVRHDLPLTVNDSVLQYLSFFTSPHGRAIVEHGLARAGRYNDMIRRVLREEGVPQDLIYLAQAESAFQPQAVSRSGARGIWQFMPYRGEQYDLDHTFWIDNRSDPEKSTRAAARHMRDLYGMFGDWYLVMAAYNSGPLNVARAIERTGYADFWELQKRQALPKETQNYVPIIIAMALVAKAPAIYGVQVLPDKPPQVETIKLQHPVELHLAADASGTGFDDLKLLNPQLLRNVTPSDATFELKLPAGTAKSFEENIQQVPDDKLTTWRLHTVANEETLSEVALHYRVTVSAIETANHLQPHASVPAGFVLNVPTAPPPAARLVRYRVKRGDTLEGIAGRFDVTVDQLKKWNRISGSHAPHGAQLRIYAGGEPPVPTHEKLKPSVERKPAAHAVSVSTKNSEKPEPVQYRAKAGETLYSIARTYQTTVSALRQSNPFLADRSLQAGDVLTIQQ